MILYKVQYCSLAVYYIMRADEATLQEVYITHCLFNT